MKLYRNEVVIGNNKCVMVTINQNEETEVKVSKKAVNQLHHIQIIDRSGSMSGEINRLIDNVQKTLEIIDEEDLLSIIWFSSPGQYRTLIKGAKKTANIKKLLDEIRSVLGTTCFSEPMKEAHVIIDELKTLCPNVSLNLFTDGRPVVNWGEEEEERRTLKEVRAMSDKILACNTIGYGSHYNQTFLRDLATATEFGTFVHSCDIDEYLHIFRQNFEKVVETVLGSAKVGHAGDIIYLNRKFTKMTTGEFELTRLDKEKNQFFLIAPKDFSFTYQDDKYDSSEIKDESAEATITNLLYSYAYNLYYAGRRQMALDILANSLMDKRLLESQMQAFTFDEVAAHTALLQKAVFNTSDRLADGKCKKGVLPKPDAHNVMDVLNTLATNEAYYLPNHEEAQSYERIGKKAEDGFKVFTEDKNHVVKASLSDLVFNKSRINVSVRMTVPGKVQINPVEAKKNNLPEVFDSFIYKTHTIVNDGDLNIKKMVVLLPEETYNDLLAKKTKITKAKIAKSVLDEVSTEHGRKYVCALINFAGLPIINRTYLDASMDVGSVFTISADLLKAEAYQKVINFYLDKVDEASPVAKKDGIFKDKTVAQIAVLETHGLEKSGAYKGVGTSVPKNQDCDSYDVRKIEFTFKGVSSLPSMNEVDKRLAEKGKLTTGMQILEDARQRLLQALHAKKVDITKLNMALKKALEEELRNTRIEILTKRTKLNAIKMAKVLTGDWFEGLGNDGKGNYTYEKDGQTLLLKTEMAKEYF